MAAPTILLAEDNPDDEEFTLQALQHACGPLEVQVCRDGEEAADFIQGLNESAPGAALPALVILDIQLPKVSGLELLQMLRRGFRTRQVPVIMFSSSDTPTDIEQSLSLGANAYVKKPQDISRYTSSVEHMARFWLEVNYRSSHD